MRAELVRVIRERAGLDEATANQVATAAIDFLRTKLPPEMAPMLDMVLGGGGAGAAGTSSGEAPDMGNLGGLIGDAFTPPSDTLP